MLDTYGWSQTLQRHFTDHAARGFSPGRVIVQQRGLYRLATPLGEVSAEPSGKFLHEALIGDHPVAGDWVACTVRAQERAATIHHLLPRSSVFIRRASGPGGGSQVVAANVDLVLLVASLNADLSLRRLEHYLATAWESGAQPVIVLTKADTCEDAEALISQVEAIAFGVPVHAVSAVTGEGVAEVRALLAPGKTAVLLGSSGVGKSTLVNALAGAELMATGGIREDDARGRHTTTHRELVVLPTGALVLDTPGMRELGLWDADEGVAATFGDIEALGAACRFRDCGHQAEPGCAVRAALELGDLDEGRWKSYGKLQRELAHLDRRDDPQAQIENRKLWAQRHKASRQRLKHRDREAY
ncbi:MAG: ribosome small subunit-dependent GTPase A [Phenylobacterium sp.]|uniref:ribosome small subunit-dependent GTPase A n=1 Tax=Phenylobacterium sp. TaxID=1871053 RepID=UPI002720BDA7|nr:ribosome small subunit-dependent GTPase A [Phenylobacterium sp.]MDO9431197.1 ribosome small subunit-dependent GTPase A [Phenylobacterium sp.]